MKIAVWVPLGMDVQSTLTFGRSDAQVLISGAFCVQFYVRFEEIEASSQCCIIAHKIQATIQLKKKTPRQTSALQGACRRRTIFFACKRIYSKN